MTTTPPGRLSGSVRKLSLCLPAILAVAAAGVASTGGAAAAAQPATRNPVTWPFAATSPWNTPIGSGVKFSATSACTNAIRTRYASAYQNDINGVTWSAPVYQVSNKARQISIFNNNNGRSYAANINLAGVTAEAPAGGDNLMTVVNGSRAVTDELWHARIDVGAGRISGDDYARYSLYGSGIGRPLQGDNQGVRAYGGSLLGGLIRTGELTNGIHHALALSLPRAMEHPGPYWPAIGQDSGALGSYTGAIHMGQLIYIPTLSKATMSHLSKYGQQLALALHRYGAYLVDSSSEFDLYAERFVGKQFSQAGLDNIAYSQLPTLRKLMACVSNNGPHNVGGGGTHPSWLNPPPFSSPAPKP